MVNVDKYENLISLLFLNLFLKIITESKSSNNL